MYTETCAGASRSIQSSDSLQLSSVWPLSPAMRSMFRLPMPAWCSVAISSATVSAVCLRPVRRISFSTNDCTPRLTRLMPQAAQARAFSAVTVPGAASMVASAKAVRDRFKHPAQVFRRHPLGVPPPRYTVSGVHSTGRRGSPPRARPDSAPPQRAGTRPTRSCSRCTSARKKDRQDKRLHFSDCSEPQAASGASV